MDLEIIKIETTKVVDDLLPTRIFTAKVSAMVEKIPFVAFVTVIPALDGYDMKVQFPLEVTLDREEKSAIVHKALDLLSHTH